MTKNYTAPSIEVENISVEQGIATSLVTVEQAMFSDIWLTEEEVTFD
ncbi:MAG: hypothetical protein IKY63_04415 [Tidjanibacter sp.]|nr:hypothetical protein [Tidjanibacter sp.]